MKDILNEEQLKKYFMQQDDIEFALVFGSVALGYNNLLSDIDIAVYFRGQQDVLKMADRQIDITCVIMKLCKLNRVDVVVLNTVNPFLKFQVIKKGHLLYARDQKFFYRFKAMSFAKYQDIKPMYDLYDRITQISLRRGAHG